MFSGFLFHLRAHGLKVSLTEWLTLIEALAGGYGRASLAGLYHLGRSVLVKREAHFDLYDRCFAEYFYGVEGSLDVSDELLAWLEQPKAMPELSPEELAALEALDLDELTERFKQRLEEQKERHDGGNKWVGTGGTSPFGHGGRNPAGIRVGGKGGGRSAVQVAEQRRFQNLRSDRVLDTRQVGVALRRLRRLAKDTGPLELDVDATIDKTAREGGEIDLVFSPERQNRVKLLLLMDVGGSMDPHTARSEQLFSAAHKATHFRAFRHYYFHNCPYGVLYEDMAIHKSVPTESVLTQLDRTWSIVVVGDAWMSPYELTHQSGAVWLYEKNARPGLEWLRAFREKTERIVWLNPEPRQIWEAPSVRMVRSLFPMFELSLDGISEAVDALRGVKRAA